MIHRARRCLIVGQGHVIVNYSWGVYRTIFAAWPHIRVDLVGRNRFWFHTAQRIENEMTVFHRI